jgi:pimeloyl-ACP methyl ester carboxylesterase
MRFRLSVLVGLVAAAHLHVHGHAPVSQGSAAPGRLIDVGGRKLHLLCSGSGSPTVILMAGGGAFSIDWALVQPRVADGTRVCSYDRAGLAWSDPGPADETVEQTVEDLHALLMTAGEKSPYLLVGASIGGIFIRAYQRAFPDEVAGLVFTNSSNQVGTSVKGKVGLIWELTEDEIRSVFPLPPSVKGPSPTREGEPFDRLSPQLQAVRLGLDIRLWEKRDPAKAGPESLLSWRREFLREFDETDTSPKFPLGEVPVVVVSSRPVASESERQSRNGAAARLDFLSSNTMHVTATGSGHEIHLYQPDVVVQAVLRAVSAVRTRRSLATRGERRTAIRRPANIQWRRRAGRSCAIMSPCRADYWVR